ncbi:MAG TPA: hypothetical protein VD931_12450, partial [Baekduia sp.]|nr:hypothetical protein [Baekduia sp.]
MAYRRKLLVIANQTVDSDELYEELVHRAQDGPITVTLVVPQDAHAGLGRRLNAALKRLHEAGIEAEGMLGDVDPCVAAMEAWDPRRYDEIVVSTLPPGSSRWLKIDVPQRIARVTDAPVSRVV